MSVLGGTTVTTADLRANLDPKGDAARVYELLDFSSNVVKNTAWFEGNMPNGNQSDIQATEETATKRQYERGVEKSKTVNRPIIDLAVQYAANVEVDINKLETFPDPEGYMKGQERRKIVAMHKDFESDFFYGNQDVSLEDFQGLATRFNKISAKEGDPGYQVVSANGSNALTSLYLCGFGDDGIANFYPMGSEAGVTRIVNPKQRVEDKEGKVFYAYCIFNNWKVGLSVGNYRTSFLRVANIDTTTLSASSDIVDVAIRGMERLEYTDPGLKYCWFGNETLIGWLKTIYRKTANVNITLQQAQDGIETVRIGGYPVFKSNRILSAESVVS